MYCLYLLRRTATITRGLLTKTKRRNEHGEICRRPVGVSGVGRTWRPRGANGHRTGKNFTRRGANDRVGKNWTEDGANADGMTCNPRAGARDLTNRYLEYFISIVWVTPMIVILPYYTIQLQHITLSIDVRLTFSNW